MRRGGQPVEAAEQAVVVEHPGSGLDPVREHGAQPGRDHDHPRPDLLAPARHRDGEGRTIVVDAGRPCPVGDGHVHPCGRPCEVVAELEPSGEEALQVDEVAQPPALVQVVQKAVRAGRRAHGREIFEEADLHGRARQQHAVVPSEPRLDLHEADGHPVGGRPGTVALLNGDGQAQIGRPETDTYDVDHIGWHAHLIRPNVHFPHRPHAAADPAGSARKSRMSRFTASGCSR